jgi:hypothetical protein
LNWWSIVGKPLLAAAAMGGLALLLLPLGRGWALLAAIVIYPLALWKMKLLAENEQEMLAPYCVVGRKDPESGMV